MSAVESATRNRVVQGTNEKQALAWKRYKLYLLSIGIEDDWFLDSFSPGQKHRILRAFASSLREGQFLYWKIY
jgi:hypothetical protein